MTKTIADGMVETLAVAGVARILNGRADEVLELGWTNLIR